MPAQIPPWLTALIGFTSAIFGAWVSQFFARRNAERQRRHEEMRATNAAISLTLSIVNTLAATKRQQIRPLVANYNQQVADLKKAKRNTPFKFDALFDTIPLISAPLPILERTIYERVSLPPGTMGLYAFFAQAVGNLNTAIQTRNDMILAIRAKPDPAPEELSAFYFGLVTNAGHQDTRYPNVVEGTGRYCDDALLFGWVLAKEIQKRAVALARRAQNDLPPPAFPDFGTIAKLGLLPKIGEAEANLLRSLQIQIPDLNT